MAFHVVTKRCFLACEKVNSVVLQEIIPDHPMPRKKRTKSKKGKKGLKKLVKPVATEVPKQFSISIGYYPLQRSSNPNARNDDSEYSLDLTVVGKKEAQALYAEIIQEIQEQHPGEGYLDKLVAKLLENPDFKVGEPQEEESDDDW